MPLVSLSVALILFEGSLTLHLSQWREIGSVVHRLVTVGALVTWLVIALATHWLLGFDWPLAILFGTLTLVTGPTVIVPMLRVVRPKAAIANILRWEGIMIDPIGALLAVVVYSFIIASAEGNGLSQSLITFAGVLFCGTTLGAAGAGCWGKSCANSGYQSICTTSRHWRRYWGYSSPPTRSCTSPGCWR